MPSSSEIEEMLCYQCEQTAKPRGCTKIGVCTKNPHTSCMQDLIVYGCGLKDLSVSVETRVRYMFSTVTNTNHDCAVLACEATNLKTSGANKDNDFVHAYA